MPMPLSLKNKSIATNGVVCLFASLFVSLLLYMSIRNSKLMNLIRKVKIKRPYQKIRVCIHQTFPRTFLNIILRISLYLVAIESNTNSDWLNRMVKPIRVCVTFKFTNAWRKRKNVFENV